MKINKLTVILLVTIILLLTYIFIFTNNPSTEDKYAKEKQKIDSLAIQITALEKEQLKHDSIIVLYKDSLLTLDHKVDSTKIKIKEIQNYYGKKINSLTNATHDELGEFFTDRYK